MNQGFLYQAIALSMTKMNANEGGPFGAIITKNDQVVGQGWNRVTSTNDPTAHAEIMAIRNACTQLSTFDLSGCEIYSSCEPCPMCLSAIYWARLDRLYFAATRHDAANAGFDDEWLYHELTKNKDTRKLKSIQSLRNEALAAFDAWKQKSDKTAY